MWDFLKSEGFKNLMSGAAAGFKIHQANKALDFQKKMYKDSKHKNDILFEQQQEDREALHNINF